MRYKVKLSRTAADYLRQVQEPARTQIKNKLKDLEESPDQRGFPLLGPLKGFRDIRAAGQRYRIIYKVENETLVVIAVHIGIRKEGDQNDVYTLAKKILNARLTE
jgi:mRNA interferase RelE/StbE